MRYFYMGLITSCTDPTYKEWKPTIAKGAPDVLEGTDPTYKEWKRAAQWQQFDGEKRTDPTYKEWKQH